MDEKSPVINREPRVKDIMTHLRNDLTVLPFKKRLLDLNKPKEDVRPPPEIYVELSFPNEDMSRLREKYQVLGSSLFAEDDYFKRLGFEGGTVTQMFFRGKKVQHPGQSHRALGRRLFKKGFTHKDQCAFMEVDKEEKSQKNDDEDCLASKRMLREFMEQAKARARIAKMKGKNVQSASVTHREKKIKPPKILSLRAVQKATKNQWVYF